MHDCADAAVIGAGVAGSAMGYMLARQGWNVVLLDRSTYPRHKACGEFLSSAARQTLHALALDRAVQSLRPAEISTMRIHTERGLSLELPLPGVAWGVSRHALDARLHECAVNAGARIKAPIVVTRVEAAKAGFVITGQASRKARETAEWSHQRTQQWQTRIAFNACGRKPLHALRVEGQCPGERASVGIKSHYCRSDSAPIVDLYFFSGGYVGISPIEEGRLNVAALLFEYDFQQHKVDETLSHILACASERIPALKRRLADAQPVPGTQAAAFPVANRLTPRAWSGLPCIGDAAAVVPPFLGGGMALALRSAALAAPMADAYLAGKYTIVEWKRQHISAMAKSFAGMRKWSGWLERALTDAMLSAWLLRLGQFAPRFAEQFVRAIRVGGC